MDVVLAIAVALLMLGVVATIFGCVRYWIAR